MVEFDGLFHSNFHIWLLHFKQMVDLNLDWKPGFSCANLSSFLLISLWIHNFEDMTEDGFNLGVGMWDITDFYCISRTWTTRLAQGGREELKLYEGGAPWCPWIAGFFVLSKLIRTQRHSLARRRNKLLASTHLALRDCWWGNGC